MSEIDPNLRKRKASNRLGKRFLLNAIALTLALPNSGESNSQLLNSTPTKFHVSTVPARGLDLPADLSRPPLVQFFDPRVPVRELDLPADMPKLPVEQSKTSAFDAYRSVENRALPEELDQALAAYEKGYEKYSLRLRRIVELTETNPEIKREVEKLFPAINLSAGDILPFNSNLKRAEADLKNVLASLDKVMDPAAVNETDFPRAVGSLVSSINSSVVVYNQLTGEEAKEATQKKGITFKLDPAISPSPAGRAKFEQDVQEIEAALSKNAKSPVAAVVTLTSNTGIYGEKTEQPAGNNLGSYTQKIDPATGLSYAEVVLNGDENPKYGKSALKLTALHEIEGHSSSVFYGIVANNPFLNQLSPEEVVNRIILELKQLNDPVLGVPFKDLTELFKAGDVDIASWIDGQDPVSSEEYIKAISKYPTAEYLSPIKGFTTTKNPETNETKREVKIMSIFDSMILNSKDQSTVKQRLGPIPRLADETKEYPTFQDFLADYRPLVESAAQTGNVRALTLLAGFDNYADIFDNYQMLPEVIRDSADAKSAVFLTPKNHKDAGTWQNYTNLLIANALVFHMLQNGEVGGVDLRGLLREEELTNAEILCKIRVLSGMNEFFAEQMAYDILLGSRLDKESTSHNETS